ncbi:MAG: hypothetical protein S4CHLAM37_11060 [Chlamydiia bacterium]|nr:hypothetical protein [Chlamydiia bacterium]
MSSMKKAKRILLSLGCLFTLFSCSFADEKLQFFAYNEEAEDHFEQCILCTDSTKYKATIAFTKHWKITYWKNQAYLGRSLITSQRHFGSYEEMTDEEAKEYREILKVYLPALKKSFASTHFNVAYLMNQAYREKNPDPHFHWHIIPRYNSKRYFAGERFEDPDYGNSFNFGRKQYLEGEFQKKAIEKIRSNLNVTYINTEN